MRKFKHVETGEVLELNASHSAIAIVTHSPSWEETTEEITDEKEPEETPEKVAEKEPKGKASKK